MLSAFMLMWLFPRPVPTILFDKRPPVVAAQTCVPLNPTTPTHLRICGEIYSIR